MCDWGDESYWTFVNQTMHRARKQHKCAECNRTIEIGERYEFLFGKCDGETYSVKTCGHCIEARGMLIRECESYPIGDVRNGLKEHATREYPRAIAMEAARLYWGMKRQWKRFDGAGLMPPPSVRAVALPLAAGSAT